MSSVISPLARDPPDGRAAPQHAGAGSVPRSRRATPTLGALALGATLALLWYRPWQVTLNDYATEARGPLDALLHGHLLTFLSTAPAYGPSLLLRAPFALIGSLAGADPLLIYRLSALPCLLALGGLGLWLCRSFGGGVRGAVAVLLTLAICVINPISYYMLAIGHPEEALGAVLCVVAVIVAARDRPALSGLLLGLAIANKEWALVAVGPVLVALPRGRVRALLTAGGVAVLLLGPLALASSNIHAATGRITANDGGTIFYPQQVWWFFGAPGHWVPAMAGQIPRGFRWPPSWLQGRAHMLIVWIGLALSWLAYRRGLRGQDALALLALVLLARCMLDPWDLIYYLLPFVIALLAWETTVRRRAPIGALSASLAAWAIFEYLPNHLSLNDVALTFMVPSVIAFAVLSGIVFRRRPAQPPRATRAAQSTTISSLRKRLSRRQPASVTTVRSSIRTPSLPGR